MKKLLLCASLVALFGANAEAMKFVNTTDGPANISLTVDSGGPLQHLVTLNPHGSIPFFDITPYIPSNGPPNVVVHFRYDEISRFCLPELESLSIAEINKKSLIIESDPTGGNRCSVKD